MQTRGLLRTALFVALVLTFQGTWALAGTTGNIQGKVTDQNGNPVSAVKITATSPSQSQGSTTGSNGFYSILNLSPDTYSVTGSKDGYNTTTTYGVTVTADQTSRADLKMELAIKTIGHITTTATASVVSRTVTGDLYAVNSRAISNLQGSQGGSETLYSQNAVIGSMPGVVRQVGSGGGYAGQGSISMRGGSFDQVGFELEGIPLNRGFDFYNSTSGLTNGLASLEVYTGGAPADAGRAMSGYVNEVINRGKYPGGGDITGIVGSPVFNHSVQADIYGGTPDNRFTYYVSTLALNSDYNFGNRSNLAGTPIFVPAGDPGCNAWNSHNVFGSTIPGLTPGGGFLNCSIANTLTQPQSLAAYSDIPFTAQRDTVTNLHWSIPHNGLNDDLQALYVVGSTMSAPYAPEGTFNSDPTVSTFTSNTGYNPATGQLLWPTGHFYKGVVGQAYNPALLTPLTWPTSGGSVGGPIPATFQDSQNTQYSITKLSYTRALTTTSFLNLYEYNLFSGWSLDQPINGWVGFTFYQLHDNATGVTLDYQNQLNAQNLLKVGADYTRDLTLRYNYQPAFNFWGTQPVCSSGGANAPCGPGTTVNYVGAPFGYWSSTTPLNWDGSIGDQFRPSDKVLFDLSARWDEFRFVLMPDMQLTGTNGLAYLAEEQNGQCLHGFSYSPSDPAIIGPNGNQNCFEILQPGNVGNPDPGGITLLPKDVAGAGSWSNPPTSISYEAISPRFGFTYTFDPQNILRISVGRYVQPPDSAFEEYREAPFWGPGNTVQLLNRFYDGLGFYAVHNVQPENSTNYDLSIEHDFSGGVSMKISPFYRDTQNQILNLPVNPASPSFVTGYNFGNAHISGAEFLLTKAVTTANGIGGSLGATFTDSTIRFWKGPSGASYIDTVNSQISAYNTYYGTHFAMLNPNAYYDPSYDQAPPVSPSYNVRFVLNLGLDVREAGFDIIPTLNYQSGQPYGDPQLFADSHCNPGAVGGPAPGCIPLPAICDAGTKHPINPCTAPQGGLGPDPYTSQFDPPGVFKGPSWWALNLGISHDIGHNLKASLLGTNLLWGIHNQGYAWEQPTSQGIISYADNPFYALSPLGLGSFAATSAHPANAYYGDDYYPYVGASAALAGGGAIPYRNYVFSLSAKI